MSLPVLARELSHYLDSRVRGGLAGSGMGWSLVLGFGVAYAACYLSSIAKVSGGGGVGGAGASAALSGPAPLEAAGPARSSPPLAAGAGGAWEPSRACSRPPCPLPAAPGFFWLVALQQETLVSGVGPSRDSSWPPLHTHADASSPS